MSTDYAKLSVKAIVEPTRLGRQFVGLPIFHHHHGYGSATAWGILDLQSGELTGLDYSGEDSVTEQLSKLGTHQAVPTTKSTIILGERLRRPPRRKERSEVRR